MAIASMHGIVKRYGSHIALDHVDLDIGEGEGGMKMSLRFHLLRFILLRMVRGYIGLLLLVGGAAGPHFRARIRGRLRIGRRQRLIGHGLNRRQFRAVVPAVRRRQHDELPC